MANSKNSNEIDATTQKAARHKHVDLELRSLAGSATKVTKADLDGRMVVRATLDTTDGYLRSEDAWTIAEAVRTAREQLLPFVFVLNVSGVAVDEGIGVANAWGRVAHELTKASGVIPLFMVANGPVVSGPSLLLALADVVVFTTDAYAFVNGPHTVQAFTGEPVTNASLGGASTHSRSTGLATFVTDDVESAELLLGAVLGHLPNHVDEQPPFLPSDDPSDRTTPEAFALLPATATGAYDVRDLISIVADDGEFLELRGHWAPNMVTGFAFFGGFSVGIVANQTQSLAGSIDIPASQKGAAFVAFCDAFNVPLLTLVDTSGFLPGKDQEWRGMIRHGAQLAFAYARATVPRIGLTLRKSYGGAYIVMDSRYMGNDVMLAWPSAEVAVMGAKGAVEILHRRASPEARLELEAEYESRFLTPYAAAERGSISAIIDPSDTRKELISAIEVLSTKRERLRPRRHDNSPL